MREHDPVNNTACKQVLSSGINNRSPTDFLTTKTVLKLCKKLVIL